MDTYDVNQSLVVKIFDGTGICKILSPLRLLVWQQKQWLWWIDKVNCFKVTNGSTYDDQAWTKFKFDPDLSSVTIFMAPPWFSAERMLNSVQLWTVVWARIKFWSEFNCARACTQARSLDQPRHYRVASFCYQNKHSFRNKITFENIHCVSKNVQTLKRNISKL